MSTLKLTKTIHIFERLRAACDILAWDNQTQQWESYDGNWFSQTASQLATLEKSLNLFVESCKIGIDVQWIIAANTLDFIKNILSNPEPYYIQNNSSQLAWQLIFDLVSGNSENQSKIWKECDEILLRYIQQNVYHKDTCRLIIFNIYAIGGFGRNEGVNLLKILLKNFNEEVEVPLPNKHGLNILLEYFICDERNISTMYLKLTTTEKIWMLQFTNSHIERGHFNVLPISIDLMVRICSELKSKNEHDFYSSITNNIELLEIMALFQVIATAANEPYYGLNEFSVECFELILKIGSIFRMVLEHAEHCERAFMEISGNTNGPLKLLVLTTITNIVQGSPENREKAREVGLIESLVNYIAAEGTDPVIYRHAVFTLLDICHENTTNKHFVAQIINEKAHSEVLRLLLIDINYKRKN